MSIDKIRERRDYLKTWLDRFVDASEVAPAVYEALDQANWELDAMRRRPSAAENISTTQIDAEARFALESIISTLPELPPFGSSTAGRINSLVASSSGAVFNYVTQVGELGVPDARTYAHEMTDAYRVILGSHGRARRVHELVRTVVPRALVRFEAAESAYDQCQIGVGEKTAAAAEMRTLVDGVQGELFDAVPKPVKGKLTWAAMIEALIPGSPDSAPAEIVRRQEEPRRKLIEDLSNALKRREGQHELHIDDLWTRVLDHLYAVLSVFEVQWAGRVRAHMRSE